jgi:hypothetical protein
VLEALMHVFRINWPFGESGVGHLAAEALPVIAWRGLAGCYRDLVAPCTEAPEAFHYGSLITAVGCLIGRRAWIMTPHKTYPNFYVLLIGKTGHTRKSTAYQYGLNLLEDAAGALAEKTKRLHGLASAEGLAAAMQGKEPFRVLCVEDEFKSLITKGRQKAVENLIPKITELFNCPPRFEVNTKKDPILIENPFLSIIAASTQAWFEESLSSADVSGGFLNRWLVFSGAPGPALSFPPQIDHRGWDDFVLDVCEAIENASGNFAFSKDAMAAYDQFYVRIHKEYTSEATARTDLHAKKLGLIYAILARHKEIEREDIESGMAVAEYCAQVVEPLAARLDLSPQKRLEERVLDALREGPLGARDLYRQLHISAGNLRQVLEPLRSIGKIDLQGELYRLRD